MNQVECYSPSRMFRSMSIFKTSSSRSVRFDERNSTGSVGKDRTPSLDGTGALHGQLWKSQSVRELPAYHPLVARDVMRISPEDNLSVETVSDAVAEFLRLQSITARLDDSGRVHATTSTLVEFSIQLWWSSNKELGGSISSNSDQQESTKTTSILIVDVQRINGDALTFAHCRRDLYEAIRNANMCITSDEDHARHRPSDSAMERVDHLLSQFDTIEHTVCSGGISSASCSIGICIRLLQSPTEHHWGLESLVALTDRSSTVKSEVVRVARFVLTDATLQRVLMRHLVISPHRSTSMALHVLTLRILAQALEQIPELVGLTTTLTWTSEFWQMTLDVFHQHLCDCDIKPLEASLAIRCLRAIHQCSSSNIAIPNKAALRAAYRQGRQCHLALERESKSLLDGLGIRVL